MREILMLFCCLYYLIPNEEVNLSNRSFFSPVFDFFFYMNTDEPATARITGIANRNLT